MSGFNTLINIQALIRLEPIAFSFLTDIKATSLLNFNTTT